MFVSRVVSVAGLTSALMLGGIFGVAGCGGSTQDAKTGAASAPSGAAATLPAGPAPAAPTFRLPADAHPDRYDLDMWLDPEQIAFHGRIGVDLTITRPTSVIWLNGTGLTVDSASFVGTAHDARASRSARVTVGGDDFLGFDVAGALPVGHARLVVTFHGNVDREKSRGLYGVKEPSGESYLYTFFESTDSRRAFPSFDEPGYKVPWKLTLHVPHDDVAAANSPQLSDTEEENNVDAVSFAESKPLPSYLVAFVAGPFDVIDSGTAGRERTPVRFIAPTGHQANLDYAQQVTPKIVALLENYFGMAYPFEKLDVAVVPRYWGTMEHPGLLAMGQPLAFMAPNERDVQRKRSYANTAIHELGHYWFGDYVTAAWWDDIWLNEGLTTWVDAKITAELEPSWRYDLERITRFERPMLADALDTAKPIRRSVTNAGDLEDAMDNDSTYFKGQSVFTMFEAWLTPPKTQQIVQRYLAAHARKNATSEDLYKAFDEGEPGAGKALRTFVEQPGIPLVTATTRCDGGKGTLTLEQRRFHAAGAHLADESWDVPVCVRYGTDHEKIKDAEDGAGLRTCTLLTESRQTVPLDACPTWLEPNADGLGYYHAAYTRVAFTTAYAHASDGEKIALLRDASALVESGDASLGDVLPRVNASAGSPVSQVMRGGEAIVNLAEQVVPEPEEKRLAHYLGTVYGPVALKLGVKEHEGDTPSTLDIRATAVQLGGVEGDDPALRAAAHAAALTWLDEEKGIDPRARPAILRAAARSNDPKLFDGLLDKARKETDKRRQVELIFALASFTAPALVDRADAAVLDGTFDLREGVYILATQLASHATRDAAWKFLQASWDKLTPRMRSDEVNFRLIGSLDFCDADHLQQVAALGPKVARIDGATKKLARTVEKIHACMETAAAQRKSLTDFLAHH